MAVVLAVSAQVATAQDANQVLRGTVVNEDNGAPIEGATVIGQLDTAATDQDGSFALIVGADERYLVVSAPGFAMRSIGVDNASRIELTASHEVIEIEGTAPRPRRPKPPPQEPPGRPAAQSYALSAADLRTLPGTANDALRAAQVLPGVARLPYSFGGIVMRGTSPRDNIVYLDGIEVPLAFHFGGISSFYPSNMLDGITVSNGGIDAGYGRAQGGMVEMHSREPRGGHWRTGGSIGLLDTSVIAEGPYKGGAVMMGVRRSYLDIVMAPFVDDDVPLPSYLDAQFKGSFGNPRITGRITPTAFLAFDYLDATTPKEDREDESTIAAFFIRFALPYERQWGPLSLRFTPWLGTNQLRFTSRVNSVTEKFSRPIYPGGARLDLAREYTWGDIRTGIDLEGGHLSHFQAGLGHKGDILQQINGDTTIDWIDAAIWGETRFLLGRLDLKPGLRLEHYGLTRESVVDPRLALSLPLSKTLTLKQSLGRFHQPPTPGDVDPNGGNPNVKSSYYDSTSLGIEIADGPWSGSVTGFYSDGELQGVRTHDVVDFENLGSLGPTFAQLLEKQLGLAFYRENIGRARNTGIELLIKRYTKRWFGLVSYTLSKATRVDDPTRWLVPQTTGSATGTLNDPNILHGPRPFDLDQRHNLNVAGSVVVGNWRLGGRLQYVSGAPYSPMSQGGQDATIEMPYAGRLPDFFQLDVRADRVWRRCWGTVDLYFDIQNLTNRRNVEGRQLDDFGAETDVRGLPILPFIGVEFIPD
ncbi:MAG TPA: TonB-dependent receptor [Kofleriaceae bacterium]|nr:TonB-dependent receptor [Kofleriaceae bacterium]